MQFLIIVASYLYGLFLALPIHYVGQNELMLGEKEKFIKNALLTTNNQFDIGLMLHKKMTHPIIMNNQFHCDRNFDPTFHIVIASFKCLRYEHLLYETICLEKILIDLVVQYGNQNNEMTCKRCCVIQWILLLHIKKPYI